MRKQLSTILGIFGGVVIVLIIAIGGYVGAQGNSSTIETTYIENIQHQDYEDAFHVIDAQNFTINGQHITQAQFIQEAQALDSQEGKITSIREVNTSSDIGNSDCTITLVFSREQKSYQVHLLLKITTGTFLTPLFDTYPYRIVSISRL